MMRENHLLRASNKQLDDEIQEIHKHGEYEFQKSQLAAELRELKAQWRSTYYSIIDKKVRILRLQ